MRSINNLLKALGITQEEFASLANISADIQAQLDSKADLSAIPSAPKVYRAGLTYTDLNSIVQGPLVIGRRYVITEDYMAGDDFTNVGAANNNPFTVFIATGTTPAVWTNGSVLYTDFWLTPTVLENTLGFDLLFQRDFENPGSFKIIPSVAHSFTYEHTYSPYQGHAFPIYDIDVNPNTVTVSIWNGNAVLRFGTLPDINELEHFPFELHIY